MTGSAPDVLINIDELALDGPAGPVFRLGPTTIRPSALTVVHGPSGSGRSSLLLALTGRMRGLTGRAHFGRLDLIADAKLVRRRTAVARVADLIDLEARLTVAESIVERSLTDGVAVAAAEAAVRRVEASAEHLLARDVLVETMSRFERSMLSVALASVRPADLLVIDDADSGLAPDEQARFAALLATVAAAGPTVVATVLSPEGLPADTAAVALTHPTEQK